MKNKMSIPRFLIPFLVLLQTWSLSFPYHRIPTRPKYSIRRCRPTFLKSTDTSIKAELPADSSDEDAHYLSLALSQARTPPFGSTYPNPPVGCVIVSPSSEILGSGHHPVAGWPHAEVFALFQVAGRVESGESAAVNVAAGNPGPEVTGLMEEYKEGGSSMFKGCAVNSTAYVTLEPCCHFGRTPPCAVSLLEAGVSRVVVGCRDPNPKVDGGGFKLLSDAGVEVVIVDDEGCAAVADNFLKRMNYIVEGKTLGKEEERGEKIKKAKAMAGELKRTGDIATLSLAKGKVWGAKFLEELDKLLWENDFVVVRDAGVKNKEAKEYGKKIVEEMVGVRVVQCVGHTITLYRPK